MLFRGKTIDGRWVEGFYGKTTVIGVDTYIAEVIYSDESTLFSGTWNEIIPETVGQYTGLTDKNGKKIFEGDIVKVLYADNGYVETETTSVEYDSKTASYSPFNWEYACVGCDCSTRIETVEVIGNIHDNPELLKGGAE